MKSYSTYILLVISALLLLGATYLYFESRNRIGFIQTNEVYSSFQLKKELEAVYREAETVRTKYLDSLRVQVEAIKRQILTSDGSKSDNRELIDSYKLLDSELAEKSEVYSEELSQLQSQLNEQIWTRINDYISEYGETHDWDYILGASGNGNIMHGRQEFDITDKISEYINQRYEGERK